jgi:hypothetical protein
MSLPEPHDAHVQLAAKLFRDCGFTLHAMQFPRSPEALAGLKRFNSLSEGARVPVAWHYHPNAASRDNWRKYYGECAA